MKLYLYLSHIGDFYLSEREKTSEECCCEDCGAWDLLICEITKTTTVFEMLYKFRDFTNLSEEIIEKLVKE